MDPHIAFQTAEPILSQMEGIPLVEGRTQALPKLMDERLGQQGHNHLTQANMQIEGAGAFPAQALIKTVELFDVPTIRKVGSQGRYFRAGRRAGEALKVVVLRLLARALNVAIVRSTGDGAPGVERFGRNRKTSPVPDKSRLGQSLVIFLQSGGLTQ